ncbi:adenylate kinase [bacterium]|nr:adenylate kinase [bacterium]
MRVILLGPPGVGKGTQAQFLMDELKAIQLSTGDLLRAEVRAATELGTKAKEFMDAGKLVPDDVILGMIGRKMQDLGDKAVIFDGFPRTVPQAEGLDKLMESLNMKVDKAIELTVDDEVVVKRLSSRRSCPQCGAVFNLLFAPPKQDDVCDKCGHVGLIQRDDDKEDTIRNRLKVYHDQTAPLSNYYNTQGKLVQVEGDGTIEEVRDRVLAVVK